MILPSWRPAVEWHELSADEIDCAAAIAQWLGVERFRELCASYDLLILFIRGYAYRADWHASAFAFLDRALAWRHAERCDALLAPAGAPGATSYEDFVGSRLAEFDALHPSGTLGYDALGHLITFDRLCVTPSATLMAAFTDDEYLRHMVGRREVARAAMAASSQRRGQRVYKVVAIIDVAGLSLAHLADRKWQVIARDCT